MSDLVEEKYVLGGGGLEYILFTIMGLIPTNSRTRRLLLLRMSISLRNICH